MPAVYGPKRFFWYSLYESDAHRRADRRSQPRARLDRRVRRVGRPVARHARRLRPARLLPARLRLRVACGRARQRARGARPQRRGDRGADGRRRRPGCVPRALRRRRLLGPRAVEGRAGREPRCGRRPRDGVEPRRDGLHGRRRARSPSGSTPSRPRGSCSSARTARMVVRKDGDEDARAARRRARRARARAAAALANPNAGEVLVSAAPGWEFVDLAGRHHSGGGSHGSLEAADSEVPMLTVGLGPPPAVDHRHQGARRGPLRRAGPSCGLTGSTASFATAAFAIRACSPRCAPSRARRSSRRSSRKHAYDDAALPLGYGQTISQPYVVALDLPGARARGRRARARRRNRLRLSGRRARRARRAGGLGRADPGARRGRAPQPRRNRPRRASRC